MRAARSRIIAVVQGKGGVGKTSTVANLSGLLAGAGYRVLAIDVDPQGNLGIDLGYQGDDGSTLAAAAMSGTRPMPPLTNVRDGLDVIPGGPQLEGLAGALQAMRLSGRGDTSSFTRAIQLAGEGYDMTLLDCPPGGHVLQEAALAAAAWALVPAKSDEASLAGLREVASRFEVAHKTNPDLALLGVFLFGVNKSARRVLRESRRDLEAVLEGLPPEIVLDSTIRHVERSARDCRRLGKLAHELDAELASGPSRLEVLRGATAGPDIGESVSSLARDYYDLAQEILKRIAAQEPAA
jgi:cellulose biosynthesis protein BcsQ